MNNVHFFSRYTTAENFATNNTMLLLSRIYHIDARFFESLLNLLTESSDLSIRPSFGQQSGTGGKGIPDGIIMQQSFKLVIETKISDKYFWGKEEYVSHFNNETIRILLTLSKHGITQQRKVEFVSKLNQYDSELKAQRKTIYADLTFYGLVNALRDLIVKTNTRFKLDLEDLIDEYEGYVSHAGLFDDTGERMHVFAINNSEEDNVRYRLYYNQPNRSEREHRFVGLYRNKEIKYIGETKCIVIPRIGADGIIDYEEIKGKLTDEMKSRLELFFDEEGWGNKGEVKFHMFDDLHMTHFKKISSYGIMGPRHFHLKEHIEKFPPAFDAKWIAEMLNDKEWE